MTFTPFLFDCVSLSIGFLRFDPIGISNLSFDDFNFGIEQPKHIGHDEWDVAMERRDKKVVEKAAAPSS